MKCNKRQHSAESKPNKHQKTLETIVKNATQMWCADPIHLRNPLQFLQLSSHCINDHYILRSSLEHDDLNGQQSNYSKLNLARKSKFISLKESKKQYSSSSDDMSHLKYNLSPTDSPEIIERTKNKSDPPPLAFYPRNNGKSQTPIIFSATEPPPLVPIGRNSA